jgi:hypothetical protein
MEDENARDDAEEFEKAESALPGELPEMTALSAARMPWDDPVPKIAPDIGRDAPFTHARVRNIPRDGDTEDLLNGLIAECHFLMREVALPSAVQVHDAVTRAQFLNTAMSLAETGAKVGRIVAKLRSAGAVTELRQRHIVEQVVVTPAPFVEKEVRT